jgi:hypothetical protein
MLAGALFDALMGEARSRRGRGDTLVVASGAEAVTRSRRVP